MRAQVGNCWNEAHGKTMRQYDWIAPAGTDPATIPALVETAIPGAKVYHRGDNHVNGFVLTSLRPDGSLYVSLQLYDNACSDPNCPGGHWPVVIDVAPAATAPQLAAAVAAVGENPAGKLTGRPGDAAVLAALGWTRDNSRVFGN